MVFIEWNQSYSVNVRLIDEQHKKLFKLINAFHNAETNIDQTTQDLMAYVSFHFKTEEEYFDRFEYEESREHKKQHHFYEQKIRELINALGDDKNNDEQKIGQETENFVRDWITNHIKISDKKYARCFNEHGLK